MFRNRFLVGLILILTGCSLTLPGDGIVCTEGFIFGLTVNLTDESGDPVTGATLIITDGQYVETLTDLQDGFFRGAGERQGTYTLTVTAAGFEPVTIEDIIVTGDECHVTPISQEVVLTTVPKYVTCSAEFVYGLNVFLTDQNDEPIVGATLTATDEEYIEIMREWGDGWYAGAGERAGRYAITIEVEGFDIVKIDKIYLSEDECHVDRKYFFISLIPNP